MDDDSSPKRTSSGSGRRRRLTKKTSSPRPRPLPLTSESSEDSNPPIVDASSDSSKDVPERRCQSQSPRKKSKHRVGSRERSRERVRTGTRRRSATSEDKETNRLRRSRSQVAQELKDMLTEGLPESLQDTSLQWSVSESTESSRLEHQQSTTSHGSSTMGNEDHFEEGFASRYRPLSPPKTIHPTYDYYREEQGGQELQDPGEEYMQCASGQPSVIDEEMQHSFEQLSVAQYDDTCMESQRFEPSMSSQGAAFGRELTFEESLTAQLQAFSPPCIRHPDFSRSGEESLAAQLHSLSPQHLRDLQLRMSGEGSREATGQYPRTPTASTNNNDDDDDDDDDDFQFMELQ